MFPSPCLPTSASEFVVTGSVYLCVQALVQLYQPPPCFANSLRKFNIMARYIRLTGDMQPTPPATAPPPETIWREAFRVAKSGPVSQVQVHMSDRQVADCMPEFCAWLLTAYGIVNKHGGATIRLADFSKNRLADASALVLTKTIATISPGLRILKLYENELTDAKPFVEMLRRAHLTELHLSNNRFCERAVSDLIVAAGTSRNSNLDFVYPLEGKTPLWLRLENQWGNKGGRLPAEAAEKLSKVGRPMWRSICLLDGGERTQWCRPASCACLALQPAMHLTYLDSQQKTQTAPTKAKTRPTSIRPHLRQAAPSASKQPPSVAPWKKDGRREQAQNIAITDDDFPPLPGTQSTKKTTTSSDKRNGSPEALHHTPQDLACAPPLLSLPCKIVLAWAPSESTMTRGIADVMHYDLVMGCCEDWRASP